MRVSGLKIIHNHEIILYHSEIDEVTEETCEKRRLIGLQILLPDSFRSNAPNNGYEIQNFPSNRSQHISGKYYFSLSPQRHLTPRLVLTRTNSPATVLERPNHCQPKVKHSPRLTKPTGSEKDGQSIDERKSRFKNNTADENSIPESTVKTAQRRKWY